MNCIHSFSFRRKSEYNSLTLLLLFPMELLYCIINIFKVNFFFRYPDLCRFHCLQCVTGSNVRIDTTLLGFDNTSWQRGSRSYIFKGSGE